MQERQTYTQNKKDKKLGLRQRALLGGFGLATATSAVLFRGEPLEAGTAPPQDNSYDLPRKELFLIDLRSDLDTTDPKIIGNLAAGANLVVFQSEEGNQALVQEVVRQLEEKDPKLDVVSVWSTREGKWYGYIVGAPSIAQTLRSVDSGVPLFVRMEPASPLSTEGEPAYYTRFLNAEGVKIKAGPEVDPRALEMAREIVLDMTYFRLDIRGRLEQEGTSVAIIPRHGYLLDLPEFFNTSSSMDRKRDPSYFSRGQAMFEEGELPIVAVPEENLLRLAGVLTEADDLYWNSNLTHHEFAHIIELAGMTETERNLWINLYKNATTRSSSPNKWGDLTYNTPSLIYESEFFAEFTRIYLEGKGAEIRSLDPAAFEFLQNIYGPR